VNVLIDTSVWSLALRRRQGDLAADEGKLVAEVAMLVREGRVVMIGVIRQELLSGIRSQRAFQRLRERLRAFADEPLVTADFEEAAQGFNTCRAAGIAGSAIDYLICAVALRRDLAILTTDSDFRRYAQHLPLRFHAARPDAAS